MATQTVYPFDEEYFKEIYTWIDEYQFSRPKRNIARDFSDGVLIAEIVQAFYPQYIELHNYVSTLDPKQKKSNWEVLKAKVFKKIGFKVSKQEIEDIISSKPNAVEYLLGRLKKALQEGVSKEMKQTNALAGLAQVLKGTTGLTNKTIKVSSVPEESDDIDLKKLKTVLLGENFKEVLLNGKKEALIDKDVAEDDVELRDILLMNNKIIELEARILELKASHKARDKKINELEKELIQKKII